MRDLLLFLACCGLAAAFWHSSAGRGEQREAALQAELAQLGAPQGMDDGPERSLLRGDYAAALKEQPSEATYDRLAPLFLASHEVGEAKVVTSAYLSEGMGRVLGDQPQFFGAGGHPVSPRLKKLSKATEPVPAEPFRSTGTPQLTADGSWLLYQDKVRWVAFRFWDGQLDGWISGQELTVEGDHLKVKGGRDWSWSQGRLEVVGQTS